MSTSSPKSVHRRRLLQVGAAGLVLASGGVYAGTRLLSDSPTAAGDGTARAATSQTAPSGRVVTRELRAAPTTVDLGGRSVETWAYDDAVPGREIRVTAGDELRVRLTNDLPVDTTIHWHGIALPQEMDGVPGLNQDPVAPGGTFDYSFVVPDPGTYWFHPHVGVQLDTGLQAPLIVEDPAEPGDYDEEVVLVLDDWTDGWSDSPDTILERMAREGMDMGGMSMGGMEGMEGMDHGGMSMDDAMPSPQAPLGADSGDVIYPGHVVNGRLATNPFVINSAPGRRIRLRLINGGGDTAYRFAVGDHRITVTHTDGFPVEPVEVDTLIIGMGERYDVVITTGDGVFPIVAAPEGKDAAPGRALLRTGTGATPDPTALPTEMSGQMLTYSALSPAADVAFETRQPDRELDAVLEMIDGGRKWLINGAGFGDHDPLQISAGERVRLNLRNESMMFHPMHIHGHTFALAGQNGTGIRKDTVNVLPMETVSVDLQADNPGDWAVHCHNIYHAELGMQTVLSYAP